MSPDTNNYSQGAYAQATSHTDSSSLTEESKPFVDNGFIPSLTGIKIIVNEQMNPNDCTLVIGTEYYRRLQQAMKEHDENSETKD